MRRSTALVAAAAALLLVSSLAVAFMSAVPYDERSEEVETRTRRMFRDWMARFKKTYSSIDEEEHRYAVFKENLRRYGKQNAAADDAGIGLHLGLNVFGDLTHEELDKVYTG